MPKTIKTPQNTVSQENVRKAQSLAKKLGGNMTADKVITCALNIAHSQLNELGRLELRPIQGTTKSG